MASRTITTMTETRYVDTQMAAPAITTTIVKEVPVKVQQPIIWPRTVILCFIHLLTLYTVLFLLPQANGFTLLWSLFLMMFAGFGVTGGAHRLWTHRSYKAKLPLRIILAACYATAGMNTIFDWVRDHRVHHKYSETDADPHNAKRGFFFAHVGWLMMRKHPEVIRRGRQVDMTDILADPVVRFHDGNFGLMKLFWCYGMPTYVPVYFWGESVYLSLMICIARWVLAMNVTWLVNSAAHLWGQRPYNKEINPSENLTVAILALGEGWHNYHHVFPWDYKVAELGNYNVNFTTFFIDMFAKIGWAYELKQPTRQLVERVARTKGDGTHPLWGDNHHHHREVAEEEDNNDNLLNPANGEARNTA